VTDLARSRDFYTQQLGVAVTQDTFPGACFLAADAYHHHLGLNVWGQPTRPQSAGALGLVAATFQVPGDAPPRGSCPPRRVTG
jgi:catechol 2,3-dioxygenase